MELRHLTYFVAVAEELNFNRAAERLIIAQPSLSRQIQDLEQELGVRLFERNTRKVELTAAGAILLERARNLLAETAESVQLVRNMTRGDSNRLAIGLPDYASYNLISEILREFGDQFPGVDLMITEWDDLNPAEFDLLQDEALDLIFTLAPLPDKETFKEECLQQDFMEVVMPSYHRLAKRSEVTLTDLVEEEIIFTLPYLKSTLLAQFQESPETKAVNVESVQLYTALSQVRSGSSVAIIPTSYPNLRWPGIVYRPLDELKPLIEFKMIWRADNSSTTLAAFIGVAKMVARRLYSRNRLSKAS